MITFSFEKLGLSGDLGNQMFQYSFLYSRARHFCAEIQIPDLRDYYNYDYGRTVSYIGNYFNLSAKKSNVFNRNNKQIHEKGFDYNDFNPEIMELICSGNNLINFQGYFQSEKYFLPYRTELKREFAPKQEYNPLVSKAIKELNLNPNKSCALHIRVGDYANKQQFHPILGLDYYSRAIEYIDNDFDIYVFTDSPEKIDLTPLRKNRKFTLVKGNPPIVDFEIMRRCKHFIIGNSSFSWWPAWLSETNDTKIVCPQQWFGPANSHLNTQNLLPERWIKI